MRLSDRASAALRHSHDEAVRLGYDAIAPEHLLLGLLREGGPPVRLLRGLGVNAQRLRQAVTAAAPPPQEPPSEFVHADLALTVGAEEALAAAEREAAEHDRDTLEAEWVLLGLLAAEEGTVAALLREMFGVSAAAVRAEAYDRLGVAAPDPPAAREPEPGHLRDRAASATRRLSILFDGEADEADVAEVLALLSELYRALGGDGLVILDSGVPAWDVEADDV